MAELLLRPDGSLDVPSWAVPVTAQDYLRITQISDRSTAPVTVQMRVLLPSGELVQMQFVDIVAAERTWEHSFVQMPRGWLLGVGAQIASGVPEVGEIFARLALQRGKRSADVPYMILAMGNVELENGLSWPNGPVQNSVDVHPLQTSRAVSNPGAGNDLDEAVPAGQIWQLEAVTLVVNTDATVASRRGVLVISDTARELVRVASQTTIAATTTIGMYFYLGPDQRGGVGSVIIEALPRAILLDEGYSVATKMDNWQAGDSLTGIILAYKRWYRGT